VRTLDSVERFKPTPDHAEGPGIGPCMVRRRVENAGRREEMHSQPSAGTTFFVPCPMPKAAEPRSPGGRLPAQSLQSSGIACTLLLLNF
jgi:hypothetical protein